MDSEHETSNPPSGRRIAGRYEVAEVIGRGGMGEVRAGRDHRLERDVAIKILRTDVTQPDTRRRFEDEAKLAARLVHPHVIAVFDSGEDDGVPYLVMERLSGRTLADDIATGPLDGEAVCDLGLQILDALGAAHAAGFIHRDVKPGNVLAAGPGWWKLGDFGIAKSHAVSDPSLTVVGMVVGSPAYMAPERLAGGPATVSSDLYATGVMLREALTGRRPGTADKGVAAQAGPKPAPMDLRGVPGLAAVLSRATAPDPSERFASATDMAEALRRSTMEPVDVATIAMPNGGSTTVTELATQPLPAPTPPSPNERHTVAGRRRPLRATLLLLAMVAIAAIAVLATRNPHGGGGSSTTAATTTSPPSSASSGPVPAPLDTALRQLEREVQP